MTHPAKAQEIVYRIDIRDHICLVSDEWNSFLRENTPFTGAFPTYLGTRLWNHLGDPTTIHLYQAMVANVRRTKKESTVPFRCDAPDRRRFMEMHISCLDDGTVEFRSVTLREETRVWVPLLDMRARFSGAMLRMCSWCKKVTLPDWVEVEEAVHRLQLFENETVPRISHTICPSCSEVIKQEIARLN